MGRGAEGFPWDGRHPGFLNKPLYSVTAYWVLVQSFFCACNSNCMLLC